MTSKTFPRIDKLIDYANQRLGQIDIVSFDVFDTLLVRRVHDPDLVKLPVAEYIATLANQNGQALKWEDVQMRRDEHEKALRKKTAETFVDEEAHYPSFMRSLIDELFTENVDAIYEKVRSFELKIENSMLVPRQDFSAWLKVLRQQGKRIFAVSDMYLSAVEIETLLAHAGLLDDIEKVISSADSFLCKASGKAYEMLIEEHDLNPARWMHVGDHPISDGFRASEAGIEALVIQDPEERRRKSIARHYYHYGIFRSFWRGRMLQQLMAPLEAENQAQPNMYVEGYNFFGPLMGVFIQKIAEYCKKEKVSKIYFLSREGWMFKQVWEKVTPWLYPGQNLPEIEYLYVSRMALAGASCAHNGLSRNNADIVFLPAGNKDFTDVCRVFGLSIEALIPHLARYGLKPDTLLSPNYPAYKPKHLEKFHTLLEDDAFQVEIKKQTRPGNKALQLYLEEMGFFSHDDIALVDIGWLGTIQRYLYSAIAHREDRPTCHGLLFGATRGIPFDKQDKSKLKGLIYDPLGGDFPSSAILYAQDLFEEACRAPHPTLNGYKLKAKDSYELVFREMSDHIGQAEQEQDKYYADLQRGILDAADRYGPAAAIMLGHATDYQPWINYLLVSKLAFPKKREVEQIRYQHHLDDFHGDSNPGKRKQPRNFLKNPWLMDGWRLWLSTRFSGFIFRQHLKKYADRPSLDE
jgi:predicted HAD superfamily hydrolase